MNHSIINIEIQTLYNKVTILKEIKTVKLLRNLIK